MRPEKILIRLREAHSDQTLRWAHMPEGRFTDIVAQMLFRIWKKDYISELCLMAACSV